MANKCTIRPKLGRTQMDTLRRMFGYNVARTVMLKGALNPKFINDYRTSLELDSSGVPTVESLLAIPIVRNNFIGKNRLVESLNKENKAFEDTLDNYNNLLQDAFNFNTKSPYRDSFVANIDYTDDGKIKVNISDRSQQALDDFQYVYRQHLLNQRLSEIFKPLGVNIGILSQVESVAGKAGVTDFTVADRIAKDFVSMIRVANNKEGAEALSEEFSHLIIGALKDNLFIQRSLNYVRNTPGVAQAILGDEYEAIKAAYNDNMDLVAEEALGHVLKDNLLKTQTDIPIISRTVDNVRKQFKDYEDTQVLEAIQEVNEMMSSIASGIIDNSLPVTQEQIINSQRQVQLNALSSKIEKAIDIIQKAKETELKRYKIGDIETKEFAKSNIETLENTSGEELDCIITLLHYSDATVNEMRDKYSKITALSNSTTKDVFATLRSVRSFISSYGNFINQVRNLIVNTENENPNVKDSSELSLLKSSINELSNLSEDLTALYTKKAFYSFCNFVKPYLGDDVIAKMKGPKGTALTVEELLNSAEKDISFMDRWLDSMGNSADLALQIFDQIVKQTKDSIKSEVMDTIREIIALRQEAESKGITSFEWAFEKDSTGKMSGDYIRPINNAEFYRQLDEFEKSLDEKYGKNPGGTNATNKIAEREAWLRTYAISTFGSPRPNPDKWQNADYMKLSDDQKDILNKFIAIKERLELSFPEDKKNTYRAIQIRKSAAQRLVDSGLSPSTILSNLKNYYSETFIDKIDDDQLFGHTARGSIKDFEGHEYMVLPILYTGRLENPQELSTDIFSTLMSYAYMATQYKAMSDVVDALEIGRNIMKERKVKEDRGGFPVIEKLQTALGNTVGNVFKEGSYIEQKLDDFFESQVYGRYLKDSGAFTVFGTPINKNKLASWVLSRSSLAQLGFNFLANTANVLTGSCMQNIEAIASEFFNVKELAKADVEYNKMLVSFIPELGARFKQSKLALFDELIDFKGEFRKRINGAQRKNLIQRLFGENIAFIGQDGGDHWLYNRTAIAMAMRQKVIVPGKGEMSLWDALQIVDSGHGNLKKMILPEGTTDLDGNAFSITKWSRKVLDVNQKLFGVYNEDDSNAANRVIMGRLLQQYRKWIKPQFNKRFQAKQENLALGQEEEGYYRTVARMLNELVRGHVQLSAQWKEMSDHEKANVRRCITELIQFFAVWALANLVEWPDDKDRPWALKYAEYAAVRLSHELGGLTPSLTMMDEMLKNVKNPVPATGIVVDLTNLVSSLITPSDWTNELQSGPYKGMSTLEKNFFKAPLYGVAQYRQISKFSKDIDNSMLYYARPY